jgi:FkbM family methyltransferase
MLGLWKRRGKRRRPGDGSVSPETERLVALLAAQRIDHVLDVGGNIGQYALSLRAGGYAGRITSFEPVSGAHRELATLAAADGLWTVAPRMALAANNGRAVMRVSHRSDMSSLLPMEALTLEALPKSFEVAQEEVETYCLDAVFADFVRPAERVMLKIDTQGSEADILRGALGVLGKLAGLQVEMSLRPMYAGETRYLDLCRFIEDQGFEPYWFTPGNFSKRLGRQLQFDGVFFRQ